MRFSARTGDVDHITAGAIAFLAGLLGRFQGAGAWLVLDCSPKGRWHVHGVVVVPAACSCDGATLRGLWVAGFPPDFPPELRPVAGEGPQHAALLVPPPGRFRVLHHHLRPRAAGLPPMAERVFTCGALAGPWARVASALGLPGAPAPAPAPLAEAVAPKGAPVANTPRYAPRPQRPPGTCGWCGRSLTGRRVDALWCSRDCKKHASRASGGVVLRKLLAVNVAWPRSALPPNELRERKALLRWIVERLERHGWFHTDALRAAALAIWSGAKLEHYDVPQGAFEWTRRMADRRLLTDCARFKPWACDVCGRLLPRDIRARTCGRAACRMVRHRTGATPCAP